MSVVASRISQKDSTWMFMLTTAYCPAAAIESDGVKAVSSQDELFEQCEVVSLHIPATAETRQSINYDLVARCLREECWSIRPGKR